MRKAIVINPSNTNEKVYASEYAIEVHHKGGGVVQLECVNYSYEDVFEYIKEQYKYDLDSIKKITIEVIK